MTLTQNDVTAALEGAGLWYRVRGRYIHTQCPLHSDNKASCQIFLNDFFCSCLAGCGRFPITKAFPHLRNDTAKPNYVTPRSKPIEPTYKTYDLTKYHAGLPLIPRDHTFKNLPLEVLDDLGWRFDERRGYFIPYFSQDKKTIPFGQWRHLTGNRRFTFLPEARPTLYGKWNICDNARLFIVEGTSDCAVLQHCGVPWIGVPSASLGSLLRNFSLSTAGRGITLVYAGDRDKAGEALRAALDETGTAYRTCMAPEPYKDWGEVYVAQGAGAIQERCFPVLFE